ncbi:cytochrome P450, partial [Aureobasidium melanogenum]
MLRKCYSHQVPDPIFSIDVLVNRVYIVKSARLVAAVQKNHKCISFDPFLTAAANRMAGIRGPGLKLLQECRSGGHDLNNKVLHAMTHSLLGKGLDYMNSTMLSKMEPLIDGLVNTTNISLDLHGWCRHVITTASTEAIWGSQNPFRSEKTVQNFWYFESHLSVLLAKVLPALTARKTYLARENVVQAMLEFSRKGGYEDEHCSDLAISRWKTQKENGATDLDIARLETALNVGVLSNTVPSTFWTIFEICSRPELLQAIRSEIEQNALRVDPSTNLHTIDLGCLRARCPLLVSAFQEVLRTHSNGAPTRMIYEDVVLDNFYLLKAGSVLQMPAPAINNELSTWGPEGKKFNPSHFDKGVSGTDHRDRASGKPRATSYMSFGASPNLCPGRHFAAAEVLSLVAMLVMRVDIKPTKGQWWTPRLNAWAIAASMTPPIEEFPVTIHPRAGTEDVKWSYSVQEGDSRFSLITG